MASIQRLGFDPAVLEAHRYGLGSLYVRAQAKKDQKR